MKGLRIIAFIPISAVFLVATGNAQQRISLDEAIQLALQNNYEIQLSRNDSMSAAIDYSYRNAGFIPQLNGAVGSIWNNNSQKQNFSDGTKRERSGVKSNNINAAINLNWTLFDGLKMFATRDKLSEYLKLGELTVKSQVVNTLADLITTYYSVVREKQQLKAVQEQMSLNEERVKLAQYKLDIGVGTKPDLLQSQVDLNAQKAAILAQQARIQQLKADLSQAMRANINDRFDVEDSIPINNMIAMGDVQTVAEQQNPTVLLLKKNIDIGRLTLRETRADYSPILRFNSAYNFTRSDNQTVVNPFQPLFSLNRGFNYGLTATIPILNNFDTRRRVRQAELDIKYQELVLDNQLLQLSLSIQTAFIDYQQQLKALALEEDNILLARENVDIVFQTYKLGAATFIQLREAQKSLEDGYNRLIAARYNTKVAEVELMRLRGDLVQ